MASIRVATFNVENLLRRFNFRSFGQLTRERALEILGVDSRDVESLPLRQALYVGLTDDSRQQTAQAIRDTRADIICLQEVDDKQVLDQFNEDFVDKIPNVHYGWRRVIDGNDMRGIDVAVMSKDWIRVTSHAHHTFDDFNLFNNDLNEYGLNPGDRIFRRDCLEVETNVGDERLTIFVCHFKSMMGGRAETRPVREAEAAAVRRIIEDKFGSDTAESDWVVVGDLNDYTHLNGVPDPGHGLGPLLRDGFSQDITASLDASERWTRYFAPDNVLNQLDYILVSPEVARKNPQPNVEIIRQGQPYRVPNLDQVVRYPRTGFDRPKASDHCPVVAELEI